MQRTEKMKRVVDYDIIPDIMWARLAAYIDGEGCIRIHSTGPNRKTGYRYHGVLLIIGQKEPDLSSWLFENFGGFTHGGKAYGSRPVMHYWRASTQQAIEILKRCMPYFLVKGKQAEIALEYRLLVTRSTRRVPDDVRKKQEELRWKLDELKHGHKRANARRIVHDEVAVPGQ